MHRPGAGLEFITVLAFQIEHQFRVFGIAARLHNGGLTQSRQAHERGFPLAFESLVAGVARELHRHFDAAAERGLIDFLLRRLDGERRGFCISDGEHEAIAAQAHVEALGVGVADGPAGNGFARSGGGVAGSAGDFDATAPGFRIGSRTHDEGCAANARRDGDFIRRHARRQIGHAQGDGRIKSIAPHDSHIHQRAAAFAQEGTPTVHGLAARHRTDGKGDE